MTTSTKSTLWLPPLAPYYGSYIRGWGDDCCLIPDPLLPYACKGKVVEFWEFPCYIDGQTALPTTHIRFVLSRHATRDSYPARMGECSVHLTCSSGAEERITLLSALEDEFNRLLRQIGVKPGSRFHLSLETKDHA